MVGSLCTGTAARGSTWPTYGGHPCVPASRARPSRPSLSSLPSETPSRAARAGLAASSADSDGAVLTYSTHILQHHWHLCRPQAVFSPFARSHRNVRTRFTHEEWRYYILISEERREVTHCQRKSWFQLMIDVTQTRECVSVEEYGVRCSRGLLYACNACRQEKSKHRNAPPAVWVSDTE